MRIFALKTVTFNDGLVQRKLCFFIYSVFHSVPPIKGDLRD